jgi:hypothetical protein
MDLEGRTAIDGLFSIARSIDRLTALLERKSDKAESSSERTKSKKNAILRVVSETPALPKWTVVEKAGGTTAVTGAAVDELIEDGLITLREEAGKKLLYPVDTEKRNEEEIQQ